MYALIKKFWAIFVLGQRPDLGHGKERQIATRLRGIREDHKGRYMFASDTLDKRGNVIDAACGIGYGAFILAKQKGRRVFAIDKDTDAHFFGSEHYLRPNILRVPLLIEELNSLNVEFNGLVSFETIEHLDDAESFLRTLNGLAADGAKFVLSVPNEDKLPFDSAKFPFHVRHYTAEQLDSLLTITGWQVNFRGSQGTKYSQEVDESTTGAFLVYVCTKMET